MFILLFKTKVVLSVGQEKDMKHKAFSVPFMGGRNGVRRVGGVIKQRPFPTCRGRPLNGPHTIFAECAEQKSCGFYGRFFSCRHEKPPPGEGAASVSAGGFYTSMIRASKEETRSWILLCIKSTKSSKSSRLAMEKSLSSLKFSPLQKSIL